MAKEFKLPELGENIEKAQILKVLVSPGDKVKKDQTLFELETDKATVEVPSDFDGTIESVHVKDGEEAAVGSLILTYSETGESERAVENSKTAEIFAAKEPEPKKEDVIIPASEAPAKSVKYEFKLPELGENIESADILKVHIKPGDKIKKDQTLIEIETDKATVEIPSEFAGTVKAVNVKEGEKAKVGDVIAVFEVIEHAGEGVKTTAAEKSQYEPKLSTVKEHEPKPTAQTLTEMEVSDVRTTALLKRKMSGKIAPASPSVRRFAREIGVDIHLVRGSGPGGRISVDDVKAFAKNLNEKLQKGGTTAVLGVASEPLPDFSKYGEIDIQPMSNIRKKTARHLSYAWTTVPHVTQFDKADITELEKLRKQYADKVKASGGKLTVTSILLKIVASALKVFPQFNATVDMQNNAVIYKKYYNIGVAVDTERGLLVPVIKNVDKKNIILLSKELTEISEKARAGKLSIDEMQGGNFSISNLGGIGGTYFTPIVNAPEVAILGISRGAYEQVYIDGKFETRLMLPISLSYDHRIIDGAAGARFIRWIAKALENPFLLSLEG